MTTAQQIDKIAAVFNSRESLSFDHADRLIEIMDSADSEALLLMARRNIKFVTRLAVRRLKENFGFTDAQIAIY